MTALGEAVPLRYEGEGEFQTPPGWRKACDKALVVGEVYRFERREDRSSKSHAHYFASISEAWSNLPDHLAERFPSPEHLRKYALVKVGHCDSEVFVASSRAEALRLASFIRSEDFAVVTVDGPTVSRYRARSQSVRAQGKQSFQEVKDKVLDVISEMIGTDAGTLQRRGQEAA